ncbi:MAG: hypothetical protein HYX75_23395 [Acidobacteria bacterium]|nr:hypothetical protein [Acidobacteriota bacterium]
MALVNYSAKEITAKVVYYGPGLCGKTTNLEMIHKKSDPSTRGRLLSLATQTDRTLFFDLLPIDLREIMGIKVRLQVYTVPGQVFYNETRKLVLKNADAVVMVLDSQQAMREKNIESMNNLFENLKELGLSGESIPIVLQYNKRDLRDIMPVDEMDRIYNTKGWPRVEAAALKGEGVLQTLKVVTKVLYDHVRKEYFKEAAGSPGSLELRETDRSRTASRPAATARVPKAVSPPTASAGTLSLETAAPVPATQVQPPSSGPTPAPAPPIDHLNAIDELIKENLKNFRDTLDLPFFETARGLFNDLNAATLKLFDETAKIREDLASTRKSIDEFNAMLKAAQTAEKKSFLSGLFGK